MFTYICPKCGIALEVPEEIKDGQASCPQCGEIIFFESSPVPVQPDANNAERYFWKSRYFWGFLYIKFCKYLVILVAVLCLIWTVMKIWTLASNQNARMKKIHAAAQKVVGSEKSFEDFYLDSIVQIAGKKGNRSLRKKDPKADVIGFRLPPNVVSPDINFNKSLKSLEETQKSLQAVADYEALLKDAENAIDKELKSYLENIEKIIGELDREIARNENHGKIKLGFQRKNRSSSLILRRGAQKDFFALTDQRVKSNVFNALTAWARYSQLLRDDGSVNAKVRDDMVILRKYGLYIVRSLFTSESVSVFGQNRTGAESAQRTKKRTDADEAKERLSEYLSILDKALSAIANVDHWKITARLEALKNELNDLKTKFEIEQDLRTIEVKALAVEIFFQWMKCFFVIIAVMVVANFLEAHFDNAGNSFKRIR